MTTSLLGNALAEWVVVRLFETVGFCKTVLEVRLGLAESTPRIIRDTST